MDNRRIARLWRRLAELDRERAEVSDEIALSFAEAESGVRSSRALPRPAIVPPDRTPSEIERASAKRALRRAGLTGVRG